MNTIDPRRMLLTIGPVLYHWSRTTLLQFYAGLADSAADTIVLGEVVCARRRELRLDDWLALGRELQAAGKRVVLAAQALVETEADLRLIERQGEQGDFAVEAGDASALQLLSGRVPLVLGPHLNIYSREALQEHAGLGAAHWVAPVELPLDALALVNPPADPVLTPNGNPITTEAWAFGRLPLAFSARCFTARHHRLAKDDCGHRCLADPDGLLLSSSEGQPFLVLNGTQTQSAAVQNLLEEAAALRAAGVGAVRLSPCAQGFDRVVTDFEAVFNRGGGTAGRTAGVTADHLVEPTADPTADQPAEHPAEHPAGLVAAWPTLGVPGPFSNGYAHRQPGMSWIVK